KKSLKLTPGAEGDAAGLEDPPPGLQQLVGTEVGIVMVVPAAGQPGHQRRLELDERAAVIAPSWAIERFAHQPVSGSVCLQLLLRSVCEQQPARFELAVQPFT